MFVKSENPHISGFGDIGSCYRVQVMLLSSKVKLSRPINSLPEYIHAYR